LRAGRKSLITVIQQVPDDLQEMHELKESHRCLTDAAFVLQAAPLHLDLDKLSAFGQGAVALAPTPGAVFHDKAVGEAHRVFLGSQPQTGNAAHRLGQMLGGAGSMGGSQMQLIPPLSGQQSQRRILPHRQGKMMASNVTPGISAPGSVRVGRVQAPANAGHPPEGIRDAPVGGGSGQGIVMPRRSLLEGCAMIERRHQDRPLRPHRLHQGLNDRLRPSCHMSERAQRAVDHEAYPPLHPQPA